MSFYVVLQRSWQAFSGLVTLALLTRLLSVTEQGWYYAFLSIAAVYVILDFGLSTLLVQIAAREFDGLRWARGGLIEGAGDPFFALCRKVLRWYGCSALVYLILIPIGLAFFDRSAPLSYDWRPAWIATVLATCASQFMLPWPALVEGSGAVREAYLVRLAQGVAGALSVWLVLAAGGGLYAAAMAPAASAVVALAWLLRTRLHWVLGVLRVDPRHFHWRGTVGALQWRMGVAWVSGYIIGQIHVPLLFRMVGPSAAAQMGLSLAVMNMLALLSQSWVTSRLPSMTQQAFRRQWPQMDKTFARGLSVALGVYVGLALLALTVRAGISGYPLAQRVLPTGQLAVLLVAGFCAHLASLLASQVRTYRRDPFVLSALVTAAVLVALVLLLIPIYATLGVVLAMLGAHALVSLPWVAFLYVRSNRIWRAEPGVAVG